ncbi:unnamed protein product [Ranitomeya imitator]|uniref:Alpha-2-macroglobulin n=1 Tax=Ranitomeya imitator TaxID=111125 RepID=A0ABN9M793_9NEOB|nr:unnamed protein product [Ranitomeya imitator]
MTMTSWQVLLVLARRTCDDVRSHDCDIMAGPCRIPSLAPEHAACMKRSPERREERERRRKISVVKSLIAVLNTPFSLTRGEQCIIEVGLFNSLQENLQVMVTLESSNSFDMLIPNNSADSVPGQYNVTVQGEAGTSVLFPINPKKLGNVTVKVTVTSKASSEVLTKTILVKAEGVKYFYSQSALLELTDTAVTTASKNFSFTFPSDVIADTIEGFVTVVGDVLGPSINGLESLIMMPYGCGEQNMINFAPNIYILLYLTATKQLKQDTRNKAIEYMELGNFTAVE